ncbi:MAG TPA: histidine kinase [Niastella sp.]|nr:histidine kinase [Niastella sp.]
MMNIQAIPKLKVYSFLFSMPIIDIAVNQILYKERLWQEWRIWAISLPLIFILGFFSWYVRITNSAKAERKYPELKQTWRRMRYKLGICCISMLSTVLTVATIYSVLNIEGYTFNMNDVWQGAVLSLVVNIVFETLYDADYAVTKYKEVEEEKEMLRQLSFREEFNSLKNQVNPHFLFNCFNTLSSLIHEDKETADLFLNELSKVYRYLLKNNEEGLSTVANEIRFVHSYYRLLQTRYGEAIKLQVTTVPRYDAFLLPSLTLQLLIENAVKHNILAKSMPLEIEIFTRDDRQLVVRNNLQRRTVKVPSNKIGLKNIRLKYELLQQDGFAITQDESSFMVTLPLLPSQMADVPALGLTK